MATILDHLEPIEAPDGVFKQPNNEYWALMCLKTGLDVIYQNVCNCDGVVRKNLNPDGNLQIHTFNDLPGLSAGDHKLLTMAFHWYATTVCQYARTIATIGYQLGQLQETPAKYVHRVLPEVLPFRDKISAHFAWNTRNQADSDAERKIR